MYANIPHTKRLLCYRASAFSGLGWRTAYNMASYSLETVSKDALCAHSSTSGAVAYVFWMWHASQAIPKILNMWSFELVLLFYLALKTNSVQLKMLLCIKIPLNLLKVIVAISEISSCDYSDHISVYLQLKRVHLQRQNVRPQHKTYFR